MNSLTVIILTFNEERHISRCIKSAKKIATEVILIDSFSTDKTKEIALNLGATVYQNKWENSHAKQFNWALENCLITTEWTMRMDADEYLTNELTNEINDKLMNSSSEIGGFLIKRKVVFMNRWIKHGGYYPIFLLRIWRSGNGRLEDRSMDEHVILTEGRAVYLTNDLVDHNLNDLSWWIDKHNNYASREMMDLKALETSRGSDEKIRGALLGNQFTRKRWIKEKVYRYIPLFFRPLCYYLYRYIFLLGFLDGRAGLIFHFLQGFWYRFLVDAKLEELKLLQTPHDSYISKS